MIQPLMHNPKDIFLCDFDGTMGFHDTLDPIYLQKASCGMHYSEMWERGEITTQEELRSSFSCIQADKKELEDVLDTLVLDPAVKPFVEMIRGQGSPFIVLSEGLAWYVDYLLNRFKITVDKVYAAQIEFLGPGKFQIEFPWYDPVYPNRGTSKATIIEKYKQLDLRTIFIGNGSSDREAVWKADVVYAKNPLYQYCQEQGIAATHFENFSELLQLFETYPQHTN